MRDRSPAAEPELEQPDVQPEAPDVDDSEEWEDVRVGLGSEWDFDARGGLVGIYVGIETVALAERDRDEARAHQFALIETGELVFLWGSYELDHALTNVGVGDKLRITFLGRESFAGPDGPRQVKRYKVQRAKR